MSDSVIHSATEAGGQIDPSLVVAPPETPLVLRVLDGPHHGQVLHIAARKCTIGSAEDCTLRLSGGGTKPLECLIYHGACETVVRNCGGKNRLNGKPFSDAPLEPGDRLKIGPVTFEVLSREASPAASPDSNTSGRATEGQALDLLAKVTERALDIERREAEFARHVADWEQQASDTEIKQLDAEAELTRHRDELAGRERQLQEQDERIARIEREFEEQRGTLDAQRRQIDEARRQVEESRGRHDENQRTVDGRQRELDEHRSRVDVRQRELDERQAELDNRRRQLEEEAHKLAERANQIESSRHETGSLGDEERRHLTERTEELERELAEARRQLEERIQQSSQHVDADAHELAARAAQLDRRCEQLDEDQARFAQQRDTWADERSALLTEIQEKNARFESRERIILLREDQLDDLRRELDSRVEEMSGDEDESGPEEIQFEQVSDAAPVSTASLLGRTLADDEPGDENVGGELSWPVLTPTDTMLGPEAVQKQRQGAEHEDHDAAVAKYMANLFERVSSGRPASKAEARKVAEKPRPQPVTEPLRPVEVEQQAEPLVQRRRPEPAERSADLRAMRELANANARTALEHHYHNRLVYELVGKGVVVGITFLAGLLLLVWWLCGASIAIFPALISFGVSGFWGYKLGHVAVRFKQHLDAQEEKKSAEAAAENDRAPQTVTVCTTVTCEAGSAAPVAAILPSEANAAESTTAICACGPETPAQDQTQTVG